MTQLVLPSIALYDSWRECITEFEPGSENGSGLWNLPEGLQRDTDRDTCEALVALLRRLSRESGDRVPSDYWWIMADQDVIGFLAIRHRLNDRLLNEGGHIGYSVRPSRRRQGHASRALGLALERARAIGLDRVLLTCDIDNLPSRRVIESHGGVYEDTRAGKQRFWIAL